MKSNLLWVLIIFMIGTATPLLKAQTDCEPLAGSENLPLPQKTFTQMLGINSGFEIERFNEFNLHDLNDVKEVFGFVRFFYQHQKDYSLEGKLKIPAQFEQLASKERNELLDENNFFSSNYKRILPMFEAGLKVHVTIEDPVTKFFPDKWFTWDELTTEPFSEFASGSEITEEGRDWAIAFLKVYDPRNFDGTYTFSEPIVEILELGNEPWGNPGDLATGDSKGYRRYIVGILEGFKEYYDADQPSDLRVKLAGAAFQAHDLEGSPFKDDRLLDYVGDMIGHEDLSELRTYLTEGIGVHNYAFANYCNLDPATLNGRPESPNNGFNVYKNMSEWVE